MKKRDHDFSSDCGDKARGKREKRGVGLNITVKILLGSEFA